MTWDLGPWLQSLAGVFVGWLESFPVGLETLPGLAAVVRCEVGGVRCEVYVVWCEVRGVRCVV